MMALWSFCFSGAILHHPTLPSAQLPQPSGGPGVQPAQPCPPASNLGCAGFLLGQLLQLWPLLLDGVQHLLVATHLLEVPLVAWIGGGSC